MSKQHAMVVQPKSKKKSSRSRAGRAGGNRRGGGLGSGPQVDIAGFIDPWSDAGAQKLPDVNSGRSISMRLRSRYDMTLGEDSGAAGVYRGATMVLPRVLSPVYKPTYTTTNQLPLAGVWTADSNGAFPEYDSVNSSFRFYRITSWGVRITNIGAALNATGRLILRTGVDDGPTADLTGPNATQARVMEIPIQPNMDVMWRSQPLDNDAFVFSAVDSSASSNLHRWTHLQAFVEGGNSSTQIRVELVTNVELTAKEGDFANRLQTPAADYNPAMMARIANVFAKLPDVVSAGADALRSSPAVQHAARRAVDYSFHQLYNYYAQPGMGHLTH